MRRRLRSRTGTAAHAEPSPSPVPALPSIADSEVRISAGTPFAPDCSGTTAGIEYRNAEVEPYVAINPVDPDNLIATWQQDRWSSGGASGIVTAGSTDGGATWTRLPFPVSRCGGGNALNGGNFGRGTDPSRISSLFDPTSSDIQDVEFVQKLR